MTNKTFKNYIPLIKPPSPNQPNEVLCKYDLSKTNPDSNSPGTFKTGSKNILKRQSEKLQQINPNKCNIIYLPKKCNCLSITI